MKDPRPSITISYDFSRSEEKKRVMDRMEEILNDCFSFTRNFAEYLLLKEKLIELLEEEKQITVV